MKHLNSDAEASCLLPNADKQLYLVLFWSPDAPNGEAAKEQFETWEEVAHCSQAILDTRRAPEVASWFGIRDLPAVGLIQEGMLLGIESTFDTASCMRLLMRTKRAELLDQL